MGTDTDLEGGKGLALESGRLGGYVLLKDLFDVLDKLYAECACLGNPETTFELPDGASGDGNDSDPDMCDNLKASNCRVTCKEEVVMKGSQCSKAQDGTLCSNLSAACGATQLIKNAADIDVDCDGTKDAVSIGAVFEAAGANITGVAEAVTVDNQQVATTEGKITVQEAFATETRWLAIRKIAEDGGQGGVIGHAKLNAGRNTNVTVDLYNTLPLKDGWGLHATLHKEDGNGTFDFAHDANQTGDKAVRDAKGRPVSSRFVIEVE